LHHCSLSLLERCLCWLHHLPLHHLQVRALIEAIRSNGVSVK
jgi:hypothetical protein